MKGRKVTLKQNYINRYKKGDVFTVMSDTPLIYHDSDQCYLLVVDANGYFIELPMELAKLIL
jgi:hypothetical protein